jgi:hypothetical protein
MVGEITIKAAGDYKKRASCPWVPPGRGWATSRSVWSSLALTSCWMACQRRSSCSAASAVVRFLKRQSRSLPRPLRFRRAWRPHDLPTSGAKNLLGPEDQGEAVISILIPRRTKRAHPGSRPQFLKRWRIGHYHLSAKPPNARVMAELAGHVLTWSRTAPPESGNRAPSTTTRAGASGDVLRATEDRRTAFTSWCLGLGHGLSAICWMRRGRGHGIGWTGSIGGDQPPQLSLGASAAPRLRHRDSRPSAPPRSLGTQRPGEPRPVSEVNPSV